MLAAWTAVGFGTGEAILRERLASRESASARMDATLELTRAGVEGGLRRGGIWLAQSLAVHGVMLQAAGRPAESAEYLQVSAEMTASWPPGRLRDVTLLALAGARGLRGEVEAAEAAVAGADVGRSRSDPYWQGLILGVRGAIQLGAGRPRAAADLWRASVEAAGQARNRSMEALNGNNLAAALVAAGDLEAAAAALEAAELRAPREGRARAHLLGTRAELELARGDLPAARSALESSVALKRKAGLAGGTGWELTTRAQIEEASGNPAAARALLGEAAAHLETAGALQDWRKAARAAGVDPGLAGLAVPPDDPLLDRVRVRARPLPATTARNARNLRVVLGLLLGAALVVLVQPLLALLGGLPGGSLTSSTIVVLACLAGLLWVLRRARDW